VIESLQKPVAIYWQKMWFIVGRLRSVAPRFLSKRPRAIVFRVSSARFTVMQRRIKVE
jgi:hypothetical protein